MGLGASEYGPGAEAIGLHEQTLAARERLLGPDHPGTLQSRNTLRRRLPGGGADPADAVDCLQSYGPDAQIS
jgi:hypothetical protein